jgi:hypothetical protein
MGEATVAEKPAEDQMEIDFEGNTVDMAASEKLRNECGGCRLSFSWFRTGKQVDAARKEEMAQAVDSTAGGFSASKRLMDSRHPSVKAANALRSRINGYWKSQTLPLADIGTADVKIEGGTRLLPIAKIAEVNAQFQTFRSETQTIEDNLNRDLEDIKRMDSDRLGDLFNPEDYPRSLTLAFIWGFPSIDVPSYLEELAPEVYEQELSQVRQRFEDTFELATTTLLGEFKDVVENWCSVLGPVLRIYPGEKHALANWHGAEIVEQLEHHHDPANIPEGHRKLKLRKKKKGKGKKGASPTMWTETLSMEEYADLMVSRDDTSRKTFQSSTIEGLLHLIAKFRNLGKTMSASDDLTKIVDDAAKHLTRFTDSDSTVRELRNSSTFRQDTHRLMQGLQNRLKDEMETFTQKRRRVNKNIL